MSNLLDKASILLTPTAYENGRMNAIKPSKDLYGPELVTNGDFLSGTSPFDAYQCSIANVNNTLIATATTANDSRVRQSITTVAGKKYKITADLLSLSGSKVGVTNNNGNAFSYGVNDVDERTTSGKFVLYFVAQSTTTSINFKMFDASVGQSFSIDNVSVVEDLSGDFQFSRGSAATRFNAQGLVENVQIVSSELVSNGNFSQIGTEEVVNGNFSQEGSELAEFSNSNIVPNNSSDSTTISLGSNSYRSEAFGNTNDSRPRVQLNGSGIVTGKTYKVTYTPVSFTGSTVFDFFENGTRIVNNHDASVAKTFYFVASDSTDAFDFDGSQTFRSDYTLSVKEVGQDWSLGSGWSIGDGKAVFSDTANGDIRTSSNIFTASKKYQIKLTVGDLTSGTAFFGIGDGNAANLVNYDNYSNGDYTFVVTAINGQELRIYATTSSGSSFSIDNVSVKEVGQDWTLGTGWSVDQANSKATCDGTQTSTSTLQTTQGISNIQNDLVKLSFEIKDYSAGAVTVTLQGTGGLEFSNLAANGVYEINVTSTDSLPRLLFNANSSFVGSITNVSVKEITDDTDLPRIDYTDGCGSWLLEPQSTNLVPYSEDFSQWVWGGDSNANNTTRVDGQSSPDGETNAALFTRNAGTGGWFSSTNLSVTLNQTYTYSLFVKKGTSSTIELHNVNNSPQSKVIYNIDTNTFTTEQNATGSSVDYGNGWYRIAMTFEHLNATITSAQIRHILEDGESMYVFGSQFENQSYATSYIPTNGATSTRLKDVANNSGNSTLINSTEGVLYAEIAALANSGNSRIISLSDGTNQNIVLLGYIATDNRMRIFVKSGNSTSANSTSTTVVATDFNKIAVKYKENDFALWVNGTETFTDSSGSAPIGLNKLQFDLVSSNNFCGKAKAVAVYKEALTDAQLQSLTTI